MAVNIVRPLAVPAKVGSSLSGANASATCSVVEPARDACRNEQPANASTKQIQGAILFMRTWAEIAGAARIPGPRSPRPPARAPPLGQLRRPRAARPAGPNVPRPPQQPLQAGARAFRAAARP